MPTFSLAVALPNAGHLVEVVSDQLSERLRDAKLALLAALVEPTPAGGGDFEHLEASLRAASPGHLPLLLTVLRRRARCMRQRGRDALSHPRDLRVDGLAALVQRRRRLGHGLAARGRL